MKKNEQRSPPPPPPTPSPLSVLTGDFPAAGGEQEAFVDLRRRSGGGLKVGGLEGGEGNGLTGTVGLYRWSGKVRRRERLSWGEREVEGVGVGEGGRDRQLERRGRAKRGGFKKEEGE